MNIEIIEKKIEEIKAEMKRIELWQEDNLPKAFLHSKEAFCADTMSLAQWLQFVFIPTVQDKLETNSHWPERSEVGVYATQQYLFFHPTEGNSEALETQGSPDLKESKLISLLNEFDALFNEKNKFITPNQDYYKTIRIPIHAVESIKKYKEAFYELSKNLGHEPNLLNWPLCYF